MKYLLIVLLLSSSCFGQGNSSEKVEVYLISSFIPVENPSVIKISFITSSPAYSRIILDGKYEIIISDVLEENHEANIDISQYSFTNPVVPYFIFAKDSTGTEFKSDEYSVEFNNYKIESQTKSNFWNLCLGITTWSLPSPNYMLFDDKEYFSLTKEFPIFTIYSAGYNYPSGYFSLEYSHIYDANEKNILRAGYKHIFSTRGIEFISTGITGLTNFNGSNGISAELTLGLFKLQNVFTIYSRYRYNYDFSLHNKNFHELSLGLYSDFFSIIL